MYPMDQSNTTIRTQTADLGASNLSSWVSNAGFLLTLAFGPIFVRLLWKYIPRYIIRC